ncbi:hypothetical protein TI04_06770 [Achromatium sp. WMS2]|nr:hypothetical protein TI04_06770 [Achromatium sp. WMS2]
MGDVTSLLHAIHFAAIQHKDQKRKGKYPVPYINHPLEVVNILVTAGVTDLHTMIAAILHDTVEDTNTTLDALRAEFGIEVSNIVAEVTDDKNLLKAERKQLQIVHAPELSDGAKLIKIADKISNIEDIVNNPPKSWSLQRKLDYLDWAQKVVAGCRGINHTLEAKFDATVQYASTSLTAKVKK